MKFYPEWIEKHHVNTAKLSECMVAGTKDFDAGNIDKYTVGELVEDSAQDICPLWWLDKFYNAISDGVDKVIARQVNSDHSDIRNAAGYIAVWFKM